MENWKNKKVVWFRYELYKGFVPTSTAIVLEETDKECLIKIGWGKKWTLKYMDGIDRGVAEECGYCKLINTPTQQP